MTVTPYCTLTDLQLAQTDAKLRELLSDALANTSLVWSTDPLFWSDSGVLGVITAVIADASSTVDDYLAGRVDTTDTSTADALRRYAAAFALAALWRRQGHDAAGNPWIREADSARARLKEMRKGELSAGASEQPQLLCESTTEDVTPTYARDADGNESTLGGNW
jgi:phage gp36-like protein